MGGTGTGRIRGAFRQLRVSCACPLGMCVCFCVNAVFKGPEKNSALKIIDFGAFASSKKAGRRDRCVRVLHPTRRSSLIAVAVAPLACVCLLLPGMSKWVKRRKYFKSLRGTPYYIGQRHD